MIDKKLKRRWVAALRGGSYEQVFGNCWDGSALDLAPPDNKRCALGVLYSILGITRIYHDHLQVDPQTLMQIVRLNDVERKSFDEIADWIEENL